MAQRFAQLHAQRSSVAQLASVVVAMRGIAAARAQQGRRQIESVRTYAEIVAGAISQVLALSSEMPAAGPDSARGRALLLFCAEHGFAGSFSEHIFDAAGAEAEKATLLVIGSRGLRIARARGLTPGWRAPMVSQLANASTLADQIGTQLYHQLHTGRIGSADVVHARPHPQQRIDIVRHTLLPFDYARFSPGAARLPPLLNLSPQALLEQLAGEYLFAQLNQAIVYSYTAENDARLRTMTAARDNIARRLETLEREERLARQEEVTAEIIELAAGTEALTTTGPS